MAEPACDIGQLDAHLLEAVLARLDGSSLAVASCVNKTWKSAVEADRLWKVVYEAAAPKPFQDNTAAQLPAMLEGTHLQRRCHKFHRVFMLAWKCPE